MNKIMTIIISGCFIISLFGCNAATSKAGVKPGTGEEKTIEQTTPPPQEYQPSYESTPQIDNESEQSGTTYDNETEDTDNSAIYDAVDDQETGGEDETQDDDSYQSDDDTPSDEEESGTYEDSDEY